MRFLADENFLGDAVLALQQQGHDVVWIRIDAPGSSDQQVLARAQVEQRIILTFDKDFGELAFRFGLPATSGIVLFRLSLLKPTSLISIVISVLATRSDWSGLFTVVESDRIRIRPLPGNAERE